MLFSRWITPEVVSRRFDAWFFLALAPAHTPPKPDGVETTEAGWFEPRAALEANAAGELALAFPTVKQLESLLPFRSAEEALAAHRGREVEPILPKVIGTQEDHRVVLPGDPDYPVLARREGLQAGVPGAGRVGVDAALFHLGLEAPEELAGVFQRRLQLLLAQLAAAARGTRAGGR